MQRLGRKSMRCAPYPRVTGEYKWVRGPKSNEPFPDGMVCGGKLETGQQAYIARSFMTDQMAAGFVLKETCEAHIPYGSVENRLTDYDVLVVEDQSILKWERCHNGEPPTNSACQCVDVGRKHNYHENMLVGRTCTPLSDGVTYDRRHLEVSRFSLTTSDICRPGKIHPDHGCLYIPYSGREYIFNEHEMLMVKQSPGSLKSICRWTILRQMKKLLDSSKMSGGIDQLPLPKAVKTFLKSE